MVFSEVRKYEFGDDIRNIDWNVTARLNEPYVKVFEEERELTLMLLVDVSGSGSFGTRNQMKRELVTEICATLAFSAMQNNDKIGVIFFSDDIEQYIPPKKGRSHVLRIIRELIDIKPKSQKTNIAEALRFFSSIQKKHAISFVLSDFQDEDYKDPLRIVSQRHDVTGIRVYDPREAELPNLGIVPMKDPESGKLNWINTSSKKLRRSLALRFKQQEDYFRNSFLKSGAGQIDIRIDESYPAKLHAYFKQKAAR